MSGVLASIGGFLTANAAALTAGSALAGAGLSLGELGYNLSNSPGGTGNNTAEQTAQAQLAAQQKAQFLAAQPQVQSNTSGSLTPQAANAATASAAGVPIPNDLNALLQSIAGGGSKTPSTPISGGSTGANGQGQQAEQGGPSLSDLLLRLA